MSIDVVKVIRQLGGIPAIPNVRDEMTLSLVQAKRIYDGLAIHNMLSKDCEAIAHHVLMQGVAQDRSFYPLLIKYEGDVTYTKVTDPDEIHNGRSFRVVQTRFYQ